MCTNSPRGPCTRRPPPGNQTQKRHAPHKLCARLVGWHRPPAGHGPRPLTHSSLIQTLTAIKHLLCARYGRGAGGTETQNVTALAVSGEAWEMRPCELRCHVTRWMLNSAGCPARKACPKPTWPDGRGKSPLGDMAPELWSTLSRGSGRTRHACFVGEMGDWLA